MAPTKKTAAKKKTASAKKGSMPPALAAYWAKKRGGK
jgi:hypothetical protein